MDIATVPKEVQDELLESKKCSWKNRSLSILLHHVAVVKCSWKNRFLNFGAPCCSHTQRYRPEVLRVIVPFASTCLCETGFSALVHIKSKARNQLNIEDDMRLSISKTQPRISKLASDIQQQNAH